MVRWAMCWLLVIAVMTAGAAWGTSSLVAGRTTEDTLAMLPLGGGGPGTAVCRSAERAFVDAGDGAAPNASPERRAAWERSAHAVLQACGDV